MNSVLITVNNNNNNNPSVQTTYCSLNLTFLKKIRRVWKAIKKNIISSTNSSSIQDQNH